MSLHPEFGPISVLLALSLLLPLPWHWRAGNVATLAIIGWLFIVNVISAVDAFIWGDNVKIVAQVWCDITTKLIVGANFALPAACLCVCIHLEKVASVRSAQSTYSDRRRRQWIEGVMCFGLPLVFMALHYIIQGHRYDIIEGYGCRPSTYFSVAAIFIIWIPPILLSIIAIGFAGLALRHFMRRRLSFAAHLNSSNSALTPSRYLRLMTMAALQMVWSITVTSYALSFTSFTLKLRPWTTWADVHSDWLRVDQYPDVLTPPIVRRSYYIMWWFIPISTVLFVAFFSFGKDAMDEYKRCFSWIGAKIFRSSPYASTSPKEKKTSFSIPMFQKKSLRGLAISKPSPLSTFDSQASTLPPYTWSSTTTNKTLPSIKDHDSLYGSETIELPPSLPYKQAKALGSYSDLTPPTPSTAVEQSPTPYKHSFGLPETHLEDLETPAPLTPPPANPRLRPLFLTNSTPSSRPLTYPSFEPPQRSIIPHALPK